MTQPVMSISDQGVADRILDRIRNGFSADRVFGAPVERNGTTVIPAASIRAAGGGGGGHGGDDHASGSGEGGGFGAMARPAGAYVIQPDGGVRWKPAVDLTRLFVVGNLTAVAYFFFGWLAGRGRGR